MARAGSTGMAVHSTSHVLSCCQHVLALSEASTARPVFTSAVLAGLAAFEDSRVYAGKHAKMDTALPRPSAVNFAPCRVVTWPPLQQHRRRTTEAASTSRCLQHSGLCRRAYRTSIHGQIFGASILPHTDTRIETYGSGI